MTCDIPTTRVAFRTDDTVTYGTHADAVPCLLRDGHPGHIHFGGTVNLIAV